MANKRKTDPIASVGEYVFNPLGGNAAGIAADAASEDYHKKYPEQEEKHYTILKVAVPEYFQGTVNNRAVNRVKDSYTDFINSFDTYAKGYKTDYESVDDAKAASIGSAFMANSIKSKGQKLIDYAKKYPDLFTAPKDGTYNSGSDYIQSLVTNALDTVDRMDKSYEKMPEYIRAKKAAEQAAETEQQNASYASADTDALRGELEQLYTEKQKHPEQASEYEERISEKANFLKNAVAYKNAVSAREAQKAEQERMKNFDMSAATAQRNNEKSDYEEAEKRQRVIDHLKENYASDELISEEERKLKKYLHGYESYEDFKAAYLAREKDIFTYERNAVLRDADQLREAEDYDAVVSAAKAELVKEDNPFVLSFGTTAEKISYNYALRSKGSRFDNAAARANYLRSNATDEVAGKAGFYMTESEYSNYIYLSKTDPKRAEEYLEALTEQLDARYATDITDALEGNTFNELATLFFFAAEQNIEDLKTGLTHMVADAFNDDYYDYIPPTYRTMSHELINQDLGEGNEVAFGKTWGQIFGDLAWNTGNMLPSILASNVANLILPGSGSYVGSAMMGLSAASQSYQEAVNAGYTKDAARAYGTAIGLTETVFEKVLGGITPFSGHNGMSGIAEKLAKNIDNALLAFCVQNTVSATGEFFEEYLEEWLEPQLKKAILNDDSDVISFFSSEALYAGLLGFASGAILDAPGTAVDVNNKSKVGRSVKNSGAVESLVNAGKTFSMDSVAYKLADKVGEKTSAYRLGALFQEVSANMSEQNRTDIVNGLEELGYAPRNAEQVADAFSDYINGNMDSGIKTAIDMSNDPLCYVIADKILSPNSTVYQRISAYDEAATRMSTDPSTSDAVISLRDSLIDIKRKEISENQNRMKEMQKVGNAYGESKAVLRELNLGKSEKYRYNPADNGRTEKRRMVYTDSGEAAKITDVTIKDGNADLKLENGDVVPASSVTFDSRNDAMLLHALTAADMDGMSAKLLFMNYDGGSVVNYAVGVREGYNNGKLGNSRSASYFIDKWGMNPSQYSYAYRLGEINSDRQDNQRIKNVKRAARRDTSRKSVEGKLEISRSAEIAEERMTKEEREHYKEQVDTGELMAELFPGLKVVLHASEAVEENGKTVRRDIDTHEILENGWYDESDGSLHLDINSGINGDGIMAFTISHELVHHIKAVSSKLFRSLAKCLSEIYYMEGVSLENMAKARAKRDGISFPVAFEESVAYSLERMLLESDALERLIKLRKKDGRLFGSMREHLDEVYDRAKKLRAEYEERAPESVEGRVLDQSTETIMSAYKNAKKSYEEAYESYSKSKPDERKELIIELSEARKTLNAAEVRLEQARKNAAAISRMLKKLHKLFAKAAYEASVTYETARSSDKAWNEFSTGSDGRRYALRDTAQADVEKVLKDFSYRDDVYLTENSPSIIVSQNGAKDLPMLMNPSHLRENIFSEEEAKAKGLPINDSIHYHGLGEELFLKIIDGLDDVTLAYRGTKKASNSARGENYFLLISQYKDKNGNTVNIPIYINEKGQYNRVFIDTNKIATVYGKENFSEYIRRELERGNLVRIKNRSTQASERTALIAGGYNSNASDNIITQSQDESQPLSDKNSKKYQRRSVAEGKRDVFGFEISEKADINEELLEELSIHDPSARVDENGNITVYHRTTKASADEIRRTGIMRAKEDMLFFSSQPDGYATDYGDEIMQFTIPSTKLEVNDIFDGEVHFDIPLQRRGTGWSLNVRDYITEDTKKYQRRENIEELLFDDSFYSQFENENRSRITESVSELRERLDGMTDENSTFDGKNPDIRYQKRAKSETALRIETAEAILRDRYDVNVGKLLEDMEVTIGDYKGEKSRKELEADILEAAVKTAEFSSGEGSIKSMGDSIEALADELVMNSPTLSTEIADETTVEAQKQIKQMRFRVSEKIKADFESAKDYESFRRHHLGRLPISSSGVDVDKAYIELGEQFGEALFPSDIVNPADQLRQIAEITDRMPKAATEAELTEIRNAMMSTLYRAFSDPEQSEKLSTRERLVTALQSQLNTSTEHDVLSRYRSKLNKTAEYEQHIRELENKIESAKQDGKKTAELRPLYTELQQERNRLAVIDSQLLRIEMSAPIRDAANLARERQIKRVKARMNAKQREKIADLREIYEQKLRDQKAEDRARLSDTIQRKNKQLEDERKLRAQKEREKRESRNATELRHAIIRKYKELKKLLLNGSKEHHIPNELKSTVAQLLDSFDVLNASRDSRIPKVQQRIEGIQKRLDAARTALENETDAAITDNLRDDIGRYEAEIVHDRAIIEKYVEQTGRAADLAKLLGEVYKAYNADEDSYYAPEIVDSFERLSKQLGNKPLRDMTRDELAELDNLFGAVKKLVTERNRIFVEGRRQMISEAADSVMREIRENAPRKASKQVSGEVDEGRKTVNAADAIRSLDANNLKPIYLIRRLRSKVLSSLFDDIRHGEDVYAVDVTAAKDYRGEMVEKYHYDESWRTKKIDKVFRSSTGKGFRLTVEEAMSLYAYTKRSDAVAHLSDGGFQFEKKVGAATTVTDLSSYKVDERLAAEVRESLTDDQRGFADAMQRYLAEECAMQGNEVSLALYGYLAFGQDPNYFPMQSVKDFTAQNSKDAGDSKAKNKGFTKPTIPGANNPLVLRNFSDVWANHVNDMAIYHALVIPLENFERVWRYHTPFASDNEVSSVKTSVTEAYGPAIANAVEQLITDINGGVRQGIEPSLSGRFFSRFKKGAVLGSLSVAIQQPSAIGRSFAYIDVKHFATVEHLVPGKRRRIWKEIKKYAPVAIIKEMGYFDTGVGRSAEEYLNAPKYDGAIENIKAFFADEAYRDEKLAFLPQAMDELTWCHIWNAIKNKVREEQNLTGDALLEEAGRQFTDVITKTQVYDSVMSRSALMRSQSGLAKMATAFAAEPTTTVNMLEDAMTQFKRGGKEGKLFFGRVVSACITATIINALLKSIVKAARDDDDDQSYLEKYIEAFVNSVTDDLNPLTYFPVIRDIWSMVQGYDVERADMTLFADLIDATKNILSADEVSYRDIEDFAGSIADFFGVPVKNIMRDIRSAFQAIETVAGDNKTTSYGIKEAIKNGLPFGSSNPKRELYKAIKDGDTVLSDEIMADITRGKNIKPSTVIRQALCENDDRIRDAAQLRYDGDIDGYTKLVYAVRADGFDLSDVIGAVNSELNLIEKANSGGEDATSDMSDTSSSTIQITQLYNKSDLIRAYGDADKTVRMVQEIQQAYIDGGKTKEEAKIQTRARVSAAYYEIYREKYLDGSIDTAKYEIRDILRETHLYDSIADLFAGWNKRIMLEQQNSK